MRSLPEYLRKFLIFMLILSAFMPRQAFGQSIGQDADNIDNEQSNETINIEIIPESQTQSPCDFTAEGAVVIEQNTGKVLYGKNENQRMYPASTTKILTALLAIEYGDPDEVVTVGEEILMLALDSSMAGLEEGEEITLRNLVYGLLINSGNDAANTIAVHIARKISKENLSTQEALDYFGNLMNQRAFEAGARNSHFVNPHGYHDDMHYTTPYDLALIGREAMKNDIFREALSVNFVETSFWATGLPRFWVSKNKLLNEKDSEHYYEYAVGSKTGYTSKAGHCLISFASKDGQNLISVVMKSNTGAQYNETQALFEYGFDNFMYVNVLKQGTIIDTVPVDNCSTDDQGSIAVEVSTEDWGDVFLKKDIGKIKQEIIWNSSLLSDKSTGDICCLEAPIIKGQKLGELCLTLQGKELSRFPLTAVRSVKRDTSMVAAPNPIPKKGKESPPKFNWSAIVLTLIAALLFIRFTILFIQRKKQRRRYFSSRRYWW